MQDLIVYRDGTEQDLALAAELYEISSTDMALRNNLQPLPPEREASIAGFRHVMESGVFRVAQQQDEIVGICLAIVRDHILFLSSFWMRPELQGQGIGQVLLDEVLQLGRERGARILSVWSTVEIGAVACYMKRGLLPGSQLFALFGVPKSIPEAGIELEQRPMLQSDADGIDLVLRGYSRPGDHLFFQALPGAFFRGIYLRGECVGYFYSTDGRIGPVGWLDPEIGPSLMAIAMATAVSQAESIRLIAPGHNHAAIRVALDAGLRLRASPHFLSTEPFGNLSQYLPSGPHLF